MARLEIDRLTKHFPTRGEPLVVLRDVSFQLSAGDNLAVIGPSGSGKSTLLHIVGTLDSPTTGTVRLDECDPFALPADQLATFRNEKIGFVFQEHHLLPQLSVLENVLIPAIAQGPASAESMDRARDLLERVGLSDRIEHRPAELSGGERERVAVARALICRPQLVLADEPTGNLDRANTARICDLLLELQAQEGAMLIVVTHSLNVAGRLQRSVELVDGRLVDKKVA